MEGGHPHGPHGFHGPFKCPNCQKELPKPKHPHGSPKEGEVRKPPTCPFCGKEFPRPPALKCKKYGEEFLFPHGPHGAGPHGPSPELVWQKCGEKLEFPKRPSHEG